MKEDRLHDSEIPNRNTKEVKKKESVEIKLEKNNK